MTSILERVETLQRRRSELKVKLAETADLRPGSLVERYRRCGKAGCHCAQRGAVGHGPSWSLTREVGGKTITRVIPAGAVAPTRTQIDESHRFRDLVRELVDTSEQLCDAKLATPAARSPEGAEKGGSPRRSAKTSARKSTR